MELIMDGLLMAGTVFAGTYCWVLSRRVRELKDLDNGLGGAITTMTRQLGQAQTALEAAKGMSRESQQELAELTRRAESAAGQLKILLAAVREPGEARPAYPAAPAASRERPPAPNVAPKAAPIRPMALSEVTRPSRTLRGKDDTSSVPKPRQAISIEGFLGRPKITPAPRSEADLIAALDALAAGGR